MMLGDDFVPRSSSKGSWQMWSFIGAKCLRAFAICQGFSLLHDFDFPVFLYTFLIFAGTGGFFSIFQKPWTQIQTIKSQQQWIKIGIYALLIFANYLFWNIGLKFYGPIRTILTSEYGDVAFSMIFATFLALNRGNVSFSKLRGAGVLCLAYLLIFWVDPATTELDPVQDIATGSHYFTFLFFSIPETKVGGFCLFIAICLTIVRKNAAKKLHTEIGSAKKLNSFAMPLAAMLASPFALVQYFSTGFHPQLSFFSTLFRLAIVVLFGVVVELFAETKLQAHLPQNVAAIGSLLASFVVSYTFEVVLGIGRVSFITLFCFGLTLYGMNSLLGKSREESKDLPVYGGVARVSSGFTLAFFKASMRQILEGRESRRIFLYLSINLAFMFVEALYGFLTNSLGLISDACHMLFDSTALFIGLFASLVATWEPTQIYSYGYGRVEVLSGFINGIFLIFIAFAILLESMERYFNPQEINTDKLLLVSTLGLFVNLIGVVAFHDLHGGGEHGGHSHSHSHGHSHGHGHEKDKEIKNANIYGVYLHILVDTLGSVGVIISSLLIQHYGWISADPICSFCIALAIFVSVIPLLKGSGIVLLQTTPEEFDKKLKKCLQKVSEVEGIIGYSDPHFWKHSKDVIVGTLHVQVNSSAVEQNILAKVTKIFKKKGVKEITIQITKET